MKNKRFFAFLGFICLQSVRLIAQAPASSDSPYSDQKFTPADEPAWYETPAIWIGIALLLIVLIVLYIRRNREQYT